MAKSAIQINVTFNSSVHELSLSGLTDAIKKHTTLFLPLPQALKGKLLKDKTDVPEIHRTTYQVVRQYFKQGAEEVANAIDVSPEEYLEFERGVKDIDSQKISTLCAYYTKLSGKMGNFFTVPPSVFAHYNGSPDNPFSPASEELIYAIKRFVDRPKEHKDAYRHALETYIGQLEVGEYIMEFNFLAEGVHMIEDACRYYLRFKQNVPDELIEELGKELAFKTSLKTSEAHAFEIVAHQGDLAEALLLYKDFAKTALAEAEYYLKKNKGKDKTLYAQALSTAKALVGDSQKYKLVNDILKRMNTSDAMHVFIGPSDAEILIEPYLSDKTPKKEKAKRLKNAEELLKTLSRYNGLTIETAEMQRQKSIMTDIIKTFDEEWPVIVKSDDINDTALYLSNFFKLGEKMELAHANALYQQTFGNNDKNDTQDLSINNPNGTYPPNPSSGPSQA